MKGILLLFSVVCFLDLLPASAYASREFCVSVSYGQDALEAVLKAHPACETTAGGRVAEQVSFGMLYCLDSEKYAVEVAYAFGTDLIDIPEPCAGMTAGFAFLLFCQRLTVKAAGKEMEHE